MNLTPPINQALSVNAVVKQLKQLNELSFPDIWVEGEVSTTASPASGHIYFSLKDSDAVLRCVLFKNKRYQATSLPELGQRLLVRGRISVYAARCELQLIASYIEEAGNGAILREFERLKAQLKQEGLFDPATKRPLPPYPRSLAIITSEGSAALQDILKIIERRYPQIQLYLIPVSVQGHNTADEVIKALDIAQQHQVDIIILARGGGSAEDLHGFNNEQMARAISQCSIPIITGIGHETDFTIADFVADSRAPTPTGAALLCLPDRIELHQKVITSTKALKLSTIRQLEALSLKLDYLQRRLISPLDHLKQQRKNGLQATQHMQQCTQTMLSIKKGRLEIINTRLNSQNPAALLQQQQNLLALKQQKLSTPLYRKLERQQAHLMQLNRQLNLLSPKATLNRGYAIVYNQQGQIVTTHKQLQNGETVQTHLADGGFSSAIDKIRTRTSLE